MSLRIGLFASITGAVQDRASIEATLVRRLRAGDAAALGEAYDAHHEAIRAFGQRLLGDRAAAEDLVHDVFVTLPDVAARFEGRSSLRTFLLSIAVNHARHVRRATARRLAALERLHVEPTGIADRPDDEQERRRLAATLTEMLAELPIDQRIAVVLCLVEERTSTEAAEIEGVPEATIRTRLFHARKKLRAMFEARSAGEEAR